MCLDVNEDVAIVDETYEYLMGNLEVLDLHKGEMLEATKDTSKSCIFKTYNWFVYVDVQETTKWIGNILINELVDSVGSANIQGISLVSSPK